MKTLVLAILVSILFRTSAFAEPCPFGRLAEEYLQAESRTSTPLVYSECRQPWGKSVLVLPVAPLGNHQERVKAWGKNYPSLVDSGLLMQLNGTCAENTATLKIRENRWMAEPANGVLGVRIDDEKTLEELSNYPFRFLMPNQALEILKSTPTRACVNQ